MRLAIVAAAVTLLVAGCASTDDGDGTPSPTTTTPPAMTTTTAPATTTETTTDAPPDPVTWDVEVQDNAFDPQELTVQVGDTVRWTMKGGNPHTVTADDDSFDSHPDCNSFADNAAGNCMDTGDTFEYTFDDVAPDGAGYFCKLHGSEGSGMFGTVTVLERHDETPEA